MGDTTYTTRRPGLSDLFVSRVESTAGGQHPVATSWQCHECALLGAPIGYTSHIEWDPAGMVAHLLAHRDEGHTVPQFAIDRLLAEVPAPSAPSVDRDRLVPRIISTDGGPVSVGDLQDKLAAMGLAIVVKP